MKAVGHYRYLPIQDPESLVDLELPKPSPTGRDLLVKIEAVSVNPVDAKVRAPKERALQSPAVLGYDAAGTVEAVGPEVRDFKPGDNVYYAGDITRPGTNSEYHLVDERIVGSMPKTLDFASSAALPLTTITAWESLFHRMGIDPKGSHAGKSLFIVGGAGGVGSIAIQLGKLAGLKVIATASRDETERWCRQLGADAIVDHQSDIPTQLADFGHDAVDYIANFNNTDAYWHLMGRLIVPQGKIVLIVEPVHPLPIGGPLKDKSATVAWELMFTRAMYRTSDMQAQGKLLTEAAALFDDGKLQSTCKTTLSPINAENLKRAHAMIESGKTIGKITLQGW